MATEHPRTRISAGEIIGRTSDGIDRYLGVPYAAPPFGERRFALPEPAQPWSAPRDAAEFGPTSPQTPYRGRVSEVLESVIIPGEDILTANIWAPEGASGLPVALWIHGGAFEKGTAAASVYDGTSFARDGVVFVSVNYRLGAEGFSVIKDAPRNLGLEDVAAALRWVHAEIAAFGGDPNRITAFGESAGGALVAALLARPEGNLLAGAILESAPLLANSRAKAARLSAGLAGRLKVSATRSGFMSVTPGQLLQARQAQVGRKSIFTGAPSYSLVTDADSLPRDLTTGLRESKVPLLVGANSEEMLLFFSPEDLATVNAFKFWVACTVLKVGTRTVRRYRKAWPDAGHGRLFAQIFGDQLLRGPGLMAGLERTAPTFGFEFARQTEKLDMGAAHALEIPYVFDALRHRSGRDMVGAEAPQELADRMHGDWVRFIERQDADWPSLSETGTVRIYDDPVHEGPIPHLEPLRALLG